MRILRIVACMGMGILVAASATARAQEPAPVRIALVAGVGERAPRAGLVELLTAELSSRRDVVLVERIDIDRVLAEQSLTLEGLTAPGAAISVGRLVAADLFLCLDALPGELLPGGRIRVIESRTGITLVSDEYPSDGLEAEVAAVREHLELALAKTRVADVDRLYVGIVNFRNEDLGHELNGIAEALTPMLGMALSRVSSVVLLDREQLDTLIEEHRLTGLELDLRTSALAVSGGIRADHDRGGWLISLRLQGAGHDGGSPATLHVPDGEIMTARQILAEAVMAHTQSDTVAALRMDAAAEATLYARQIELLTQQRYGQGNGPHYLRGPRASASRYAPQAEAAFALHPTQKHRAMVAALAADPRGIEFAAEYWREATRHIDAAENPILSFNLSPPGGRFTQAQRPWPDSMIALQQETLLRELTTHPNMKLAFISFHHWCADVHEWGHYLKALYTLSEIMQQSVGRNTSRYDDLFHMAVFGWGTVGGFDPFADSDQADELAETLDWMRSQDDTALFVASHMLLRMRASRERTVDPESAKAVLQHLAAHPRNLESLLLDSVFMCFDHIRDRMGSPDWQERKQLMFAMLESLADAGNISDLRRCLTFPQDRGRPPLWMQILQHAETVEREHYWLIRFRGMMRDHRNSSRLQSTDRSAIDHLMDAIAARLTELDGGSLEPDDEWARYRISRVRTEGRPDGQYKLLHMVYREDVLVMVWADVPPMPAFPREVTLPVNVMVTTLHPDGGPHITWKSLSLDPDPARGDPRLSQQYWRGTSHNSAVQGVEHIDDTVYIATLHDGLLVFRRNKAYRWPDSRLRGHVSTCNIMVLTAVVSLGMFSSWQGRLESILRTAGIM